MAEEVTTGVEVTMVVASKCEQVGRVGEIIVAV